MKFFIALCVCFLTVNTTHLLEDHLIFAEIKDAALKASYIYNFKGETIYSDIWGGPSPEDLTRWHQYQRISDDLKPTIKHIQSEIAKLERYPDEKEQMRILGKFYFPTPLGTNKKVNKTMSHPLQGHYTDSSFLIDEHLVGVQAVVDTWFQSNAADPWVVWDGHKDCSDDGREVWQIWASNHDDEIADNEELGLIWTKHDGNLHFCKSNCFLFIYKVDS
ncbi:hypothetical protein NEOLI_001617 [Neolecta irregularis DAH-3]|uniref:Uncharacterized protein n=1 Tax=Neolecta irregularis (strain DAH-3) TaxID=1198029 RepID=A0A1U7LSI9_NEOID|nr:hypothetical protein NEOLI_001617 [Neolecta irregularis DAH-3]|eukprot:OLL25635.1 hypothetical protein NEOLI_001617 [Neolecta irregularis DAH-3]